MAVVALTREEYRKKAKGLVFLAEFYLSQGDFNKVEIYIQYALEALQSARVVSSN